MPVAASDVPSVPVLGELEDDYFDLKAENDFAADLDGKPEA